MPVSQFSDAKIDSHAYDWLERSNPIMPPVLQEKYRKDWCHAAWSESQNFMTTSEEVIAFDRYLRYLMGQQWPTKRPSYKASPVNNLLLRSMEETVAVLTDIRMAYEVTSENKTWDQTAQVLTKTAKSWWVNQHVDMSMAMAVIHAYVTTGFIRLVWNPKLFNGKGDFQAIPEGVNSVMPIGPSHDVQDWEGLIYRGARPLSWFKRKFPKAWFKVKPSSELNTYTKSMARPRFVGQTAFDLLSPQMQRAIGAKPQFGESVLAQSEYTEFWIRDYTINTSQNLIPMGEPGTNWYYEAKPGEYLYPRGRLIITGGKDLECLHDGPNPFWHGRWPFIGLRLKPVPWMFHGISELRTKIPLQDIVNHILAGILDMVKKAINPVLMFPNNAFSTAVQSSMDPSMPNAKLAYNPQSISKPEYARAPELPSFVYNTMQYAQEQLQDDSGLLDVAGLSRKKVTPAGDTLGQLKEPQQTIMRLRGRYIELAVGEVGEQMTPNYFQFYTLERRMFLHGQMGVLPQDVFDWNPRTLIPQGVDPQQYIRNFSFRVAPGSLLNANRTEQATLAMALRRQGDFSRKTLFEILDMGSLYDKVIRELQEEQQQMVQSAMVQQLMAAFPQLAGLFGPGMGGGGGGVPPGGSNQGGNQPRKGEKNPENLVKAEP